MDFQASFDTDVEIDIKVTIIDDEGDKTEGHLMVGLLDDDPWLDII